MDQQEQREKRRVNRASFACAAVVVAGCLLFGLVAAMLLGCRFSADGAVRKNWRTQETLQMGDFTVYYELAQGDVPCIDRFVAVEKVGFLYARQASSGKLVYPAGSDVPAGQLFSYQDGKQWHHVLIMNLTLPQGADRQVDRLVIRQEAVEVALNSCFSTPRRFSEFTLDGVTFEVRAN